MIEAFNLRKHLSYSQARRLADSLYERLGESALLAFILVKDQLGYSVRVIFDGNNQQQVKGAVAVYDMLRYEEGSC